MAEPEKLVILVTHGPSDPVMATIPIVMACAGLASDMQVVVGFQGLGVCLMHEHEADTVEAPGFPPLKQLIADFLELGGKLLVCNPCAKAYGILDSLRDNTELVAAGRLIAEISTAKATLTY